MRKMVLFIFIGTIVISIFSCNVTEIANDNPLPVENEIKRDEVIQIPPEKILLSLIKESINCAINNCVYSLYNNNKDYLPGSEPVLVTIPGKEAGSLDLSSIILSDLSTDRYEMTLTFNNFSYSADFSIDSGELKVTYTVVNGSVLYEAFNMMVPETTTNRVIKGNLEITDKQNKHTFSIDGSDQISKCFRGVAGYNQTFNYTYILDGETSSENHNNSFTESEQFTVMFVIVNSINHIMTQGLTVSTENIDKKLTMKTPVLTNFDAGSLTMDIKSQSVTDKAFEVLYTGDFKDLSDKNFMGLENVNGTVSSLNSKYFNGNTYMRMSSKSLEFNIKSLPQLTSGNYSFDLEIETILKDGVETIKSTGVFMIHNKTWYLQSESIVNGN
ncbi:MAG: hypothetical protein A2015_05460 [Spirochaetes bacterium GWF1_31_7]|nr:MAG: hypothetical protein A2Y30_04750 [Spirochaetes bacterium GWE1_32_154]OHD47811.1 MAG: hypothetical protein A2Y29_09520 [Spirochaetes bacterium GWE2_31_10]OHD52539.1 MAG: hypothetical protein A2015_05460 [Spirochaetes bacterium GWF1_31_7]OHD80742.1 MAG: hypothetical protein A2355_17475 [Spirochaetes bacterium RIFOXYB1_FULL_32_8]HBD93414.1 hypothetical protein [Spirochaetia bacterium]